MRLKTLNDIAMLGDHAKRQLANKISGGDLKSAFETKSSGNKNQDPAKVKAKNKRATRVSKDPSTGLNFCLYPNPDPAVWLHIELERKYRSCWDGGELATEMIIPGHEHKFRFDYALLSSKILIEFDGFAFHSDLKSFKKDRQKSRFALTKGWVVYNVTNSMVRNELDIIMSDIATIFEIRKNIGWGHVERVGRTYSRYIQKDPLD